MPPTREQRDAFALCGAKTKTGSPCRMFAGQGTSHVGIGRCFKHGGASPTHEKHAAKISLQQRLHSEAEALTGEEAQPHRILKSLMQTTGGRLRWLDKELSREHTAEAERLFKQERQHLSWVAKMCSEANVEQIEATLKQAEAEALARLVRVAAQHAGLTGDRLTALGVGLRLAVAETQGDSEAAERTTAALAQLRERIADDDRHRIEREAQRLTGLVPAAELAPGEDPAWMAPPEAAKPEPADEPEWTPEPAPQPAPEPPGVRRPRSRPTFTNHKTDAPPGGGGILGQF